MLMVMVMTMVVGGCDGYGYDEGGGDDGDVGYGDGGGGVGGYDYGDGYGNGGVCMVSMLMVMVMISP